MGTYILRRILLMVPTLIGITFLLFLLMALAPGGIGAGLFTPGGEAADNAQRAAQQAYLEDRYGLKDPVLVQYGRWLGRVSPIKFGDRDQLRPNGEVVRPPPAVREPPGWQWFVTSLPAEPAPGPSPLAGIADESERQREFDKILSGYLTLRIDSVRANGALSKTIEEYLTGKGVRNITNRDGDLRLDRVLANPPDKADPAFAAVAARWAATLAAYERAQAARAAAVAAFALKPYPEAGLAVIPGVVSVAWPDFGVSFARGRPVTQLIADALPVTLLINLIAFPIIYFIAIPCGVLAAVRKGTWIDSGLGATMLVLWSIPTVVASVLLVGFVANKEFLGWFPATGLSSAGSEAMPFLPGALADGTPSGGWLLDRLSHVVLPVLCLVYGGFAVLSKQTRAAMLDNFSADYVRTAKAKGVAEVNVILQHVFRNSLLPLITMFATVFPAMLGGSVVVERVFSIPGMGQLMVEAAQIRDRELILANALMIAVVTLVALLLADILYALADPRVAFK